MSLLLVRNAAAVPDPPLQPVAAVVTLSSSSLRITATGDAPAGWLSWEIEESTTGTGGWSNISTGPATFDKTGLGSGVTRYYRVRGTTNVGQVSAYSAVVDGTTGTASVKKWDPGHWILPDAQMFPAKYDQRTNEIALINGVSAFKGAELIVNWGMVETSQGVYDWSRVDTEIAQLAAMGKKAMLSLWFQSFAGTRADNIYAHTVNPSYGRVLPLYLETAGYVGTRLEGGICARLDIAACMDRYIAWIQACAARYDSNPTVSMVRISELSNSFSVSEANVAAPYSSANWVAQTLRIPLLMQQAFPRTGTATDANFNVSVEATKAFVAESLLRGHGIAGPDINVWPLLIEYDSWNALEYRGAGELGGGLSFSGVDHRGELPCVFDVQVIRTLSCTPLQHFDYANSTLGSTHIPWTVYTDTRGGYVRGNVGYNPNFTWEAVKAFCIANPTLARTATPSRW